MGLDDDDGKRYGCGLGQIYSNVFRRHHRSNSHNSAASPARDDGGYRSTSHSSPARDEGSPWNPRAPAPAAHLQQQQQYRQSNPPVDARRRNGENHLLHQQYRQSNLQSGGEARRKEEHNPALVRASSGNVMLYGNLGNLRAPGAVTLNRGDVLDFLPMTADEIKQKQTDEEVKQTQMSDRVKQQQQQRGERHRQQQRGSTLCRALSVREDPEMLKKKGNDEYMAGNYVDAVDYYERAISVDPSRPAYWSNKAAALMAMGRILDAIADCREAIRVDPSFGRAHHRLGTLYLRTGLGDRAARQYKLARQDAGPEDVERAYAVQALVARCHESRRRGSWQKLLAQAQAAAAEGADASPVLACYQAEALLALQRHDEAEAALLVAKNAGMIGTDPDADTTRVAEVFGAESCAYLLATRALVDTAMGRPEAAAEEALRADPASREAAAAARQARAVAAARGRGNALFKDGKLREAGAAYGQGLREQPHNATLLCNRAACRSRLGEWEAALRDCDAALALRPSYGKARLRRAACCDRLGRWEESARDYEALLRETPGDEEVAAALAHAREQLGGAAGGHAR